MNKSRNEIKWAPFDSLFHSSEVLKELNEKNKICSKPILSEDDLQYLEENILSANHTKETVIIKYYLNGLIYQKKE